MSEKLCSECKRLVEAEERRDLSYTKQNSRLACPQCYERVMKIRSEFKKKVPA